MKRYLIILLVLTCAACNSNSVDKGKSATDSTAHMLSADLVSNPNTANGVDKNTMAQMATMDFKDTLHNFGAIQQGEIVQHDFAFTNNGKMPLIISNAVGSCGCTVPDYPRDPVAPGQSAVLHVKFNSAGKSGHQEKSVSITTNGKRGTYMLYIQVDVNVPKGGSDN